MSREPASSPPAGGDPVPDRRFRRYVISFLIALPMAGLLQVLFPGRREDPAQFAAFVVVGVGLFALAWWAGGRIDAWLEARRG